MLPGAGGVSREGGGHGGGPASGAGLHGWPAGGAQATAQSGGLGSDADARAGAAACGLRRDMPGGPGIHDAACLRSGVQVIASPARAAVHACPVGA